MIKSLFIKDYALIDNVNVEFGHGLNIITGETGAGKSIIIDAMGLLLGERASVEVVRKGSEKSVIEGIFDVEANKKVRKYLKDNEFDSTDELIVRREISVKGSNRCFINDTPATLANIKEIGNFLVDIHGQHEHQSLLRTETHVEMLDEFCNLEDKVKLYREKIAILKSLGTELKEFRQKEQSYNEKRDFLAFQIKEIDQISPRENEEDELLDELNILENSEKLLESSNAIYSQLYDSEASVYDNLVNIKNNIDSLSGIDKKFEEILAECASAVTLVQDMADFMRSYKDKIELDPQRLETVRERLGALNLLKKKYGGSVKALLEHREKIGEEFDIAQNFQERISMLSNEIEGLRSECGKFALMLSLDRTAISKEIETEVENALASLGIPDSIFKVRIFQEEADQNENEYVTSGGKNYRFNNNGIDNIEFLISTNKGEDPKNLAKVASGGEISRIMLSLKKILAKKDKLPLLIFDEIDSGISGRIAQKVGQALKSLAAFHQIISITHLPQIAGLADQHFSVEKSVIGERVVSVIRKLDQEERIREVAKLMSGEEITDASLNGARELIGGVK